MDPNLAEAISYTETKHNPYKTRFERNWVYFKDEVDHARYLDITAETEINHQQTSWGAMQVMGSVARELGYLDYLPLLVHLDQAITYACKKLVQLKTKKHPTNEQDLISCYNAGHVHKEADGSYSNKKYVNDVWSVLCGLRGHAS